MTGMAQSGSGGPPLLAGPETKPRIVLIGGDGARSGVPRHISHICNALEGRACLTVVSDRDKGGYRNVPQHVAIPGLGTRRNLVEAVKAAKILLAYLRTSDADLFWFHARLPVIIARLALLLRLWQPTSSVAVGLRLKTFLPAV